MPKIGLPSLKESDASIGVRTWGPTTAYAAGIGLAASWDVDLAKEVGASLGRDARSRGVHILLGPGLNIYRAPMNGRNFEYLGEDPYLAGQIAAQCILGLQSQDVVATAKHYAANNMEYDRHRINAIIDERTLREIYLPAFEAAVKQGNVGIIMDSYNLVNGEHSTQNKFLNIDILKKDWGFRGVLMSDYNATYDGIAAANAGLDLENPSSKYMNAETLLPAIKSGQVSMATLDDKVRRLLRLAIEFGFLDGHEQEDFSIPRYSHESQAIALHSGEESMVLLKNQANLLPLDMSRVHSIAVIGPEGFPDEASGGGSAHVTPFAPVSFVTGLSDALAPGVTVHSNRGVRELPDVFEDARFFTDPQGLHPGLQQEEFSNPNFLGPPAKASTVPNPRRWSWNYFAPIAGDNPSVRWTGYYIPQTSGRQVFVAASDWRDSYSLYVSGRVVLTGKPGQGEPQAAYVDLPAQQPVEVRLEYLPGAHNIRMALAAAAPEDLLELDVKQVAARADVVVLAVGFDPIIESEGYDRTYGLPPGQDDLINTVMEANPRTIVVLTAGGSVDARPWIDRVPALIQSWYGGSEAGRALTEALTGQVNPSGKLPITWWRRVEDNPAYPNYYEIPGTRDVQYREGVFLGYRAYGRESQAPPLFPFGYGLSYTQFAFRDLIVSEANSEGPIKVRFEVENTGSRAGAEVAEVYVGDPSATVPRPDKELKAFARVMLKPGESRQVEVTLDRRSLAYWSVKSGDWKVDPGQFVVYVGDSSEHVPLQARFTVQ